jgi:hypothetical protein
MDTDCFRHNLAECWVEEFQKKYLHPTKFPYILVFLFIIKYLDNTYMLF